MGSGVWELSLVVWSLALGRPGQAEHDPDVRAQERRLYVGSFAYERCNPRKVFSISRN